MGCACSRQEGEDKSGESAAMRRRRQHYAAGDQPVTRASSDRRDGARPPRQQSNEIGSGASSGTKEMASKKNPTVKNCSDWSLERTDEGHPNLGSAAVLLPTTAAAHAGQRATASPEMIGITGTYYGGQNETKGTPTTSGVAVPINVVNSHPTPIDALALRSASGTGGSESLGSNLRLGRGSAQQLLRVPGQQTDAVCSVVAASARTSFDCAVFDGVGAMSDTCAENPSTRGHVPPTNIRNTSETK
jgi:hypothetical protein